MESLKTLENKLANLYKDLPALPKSTKESIVSFWPIVVAVLGVLQLFAAWALWRLFDRANDAANFVNSFTSYYTNTTVGYSAFDKTVIYLGIAILAVEAVVMLLAVSPLNKRQRRGWDLIFLAAVVQVVYAVVSTFIDGRGVGSLIMNLLGSAVGFYFLFQIREYYTGKVAAKKAA